MAEPILVAVAWPYANAEIHVGNLTGAYRLADIFKMCREGTRFDGLTFPPGDPRRYASPQTDYRAY